MAAPPETRRRRDPRAASTATAGTIRPRIAIASREDREAIYALRHQVYALELGQHSPAPERKLRDALDDFNAYLCVKLGEEVAGFVSITPPGHGRYSLDKYLPRAALPFPADGGLFEVRLLTVAERHRGKPLAALLLYAALRWVEARGGTRIAAIGRRDLKPFYEQAGLCFHGQAIRSGRVEFELMSATVAELRARAGEQARAIARLERGADWDLEEPFRAPGACFHGGSSFTTIGEDFDRLERRRSVINADVLDAWFPPAPGAVAALRSALAWLARTSPPAAAAGLVRAIARARGLPEECLLPAAGSSALIFLALREWLRPDSRALILDPGYGEYAHVLERVIGCAVEPLALSRARQYRVDLAELEARLAGGRFDLAVLVNPNNPTGEHLPRRDLEEVLARAPARTRVWIDEAYIDYVHPGESLESFACHTPNVVVAKSLSKTLALSGLRVAYLAAAPEVAARLRALTPPWAVSLPAQVAAVAALKDPAYYERRHAETAVLRAELAAGLREIGGLEVLEGCANFILFHLGETDPDAATVAAACRERGLHLREAGLTSPVLGRTALRIAVKDRRTQARMLKVLARVLREIRRGR